MWSTSAQPSTTTSTVQLYCEDPERHISPDDEYHEDCWQNIYSTYQPDREPFYTKVHKVLDAVNLADIPYVPLETAPWIQQPPAKSAHAHLKPIFRQIADLTTSHWQTAWDNEETGAFYRQLQPDVSYKIKYRIQLRRKDTTITRLRLGQSMTNVDLYKIRLRDNADCAICRTSETTEHYLLACPVQQQIQDELRRACIRINKPYDIKTTASCADVTYNWIVSTKRQL